MESTTGVYEWELAVDRAWWDDAYAEESNWRWRIQMDGEAGVFHARLDVTIHALRE